ncbi:DUF4124 domain-containing protein [Chitinibacteraceae bacterium HSL-7]
MTTFTLKSLLALFAFLPALASASVYKCQLADGRTEYQSSPCATGARSSTVKIHAAPAAPTPTKVAAQGQAQCIGKQMSLSFDAIGVATALQVIADFSGNQLELRNKVDRSGSVQYTCTDWDAIVADLATRFRLEARISPGTISVTQR